MVQDGILPTNERIVFGVRVMDASVIIFGGHEGVQLLADGPYWATTNIGADNPEDYGYYFWWGDTVGYKRVGSSWDAVDGSKTGFGFRGDNCPSYGKSNAQLQSEGYIDSTGNLVAARDAAAQHWGNGWRMPTAAEIEALELNTTTEFTTCNGVSGRLVKGKGDYASKTIFIPAAGCGYGSSSYLYHSGSYGYCWSSTPNSSYSDYAYFLYFNSDSFRLSYYGSYRYYGRPVRALLGFTK